jgi:hypothetical protein
VLAATVSCAGGPWSTRRRLFSGSIRRPRVNVVVAVGVVEEMGYGEVEDEVSEICVTRVVRARWRIDVVRFMEENV